MAGVRAVFHAATLHKPHVATHEPPGLHRYQRYGHAQPAGRGRGGERRVLRLHEHDQRLRRRPRPARRDPAAWVTEDVALVPKNIYGVTKAAAEDLCQLFHRNQGLACLVLRTSRFFPEQDDDRRVRDAYPDDNVKSNEYLYRRVDIQDVVDALLLASKQHAEIGFRKYIISATTPFLPEDLTDLRVDAPQAVRRRVPEYGAEYGHRGWRMFPSIGRVYVNQRAREELGWRPRYDFNFILDRLAAGDDPRSPSRWRSDRRDTIPRHFPTAHTRSTRSPRSYCIIPG